VDRIANLHRCPTASSTQHRLYAKEETRGGRGIASKSGARGEERPKRRTWRGDSTGSEIDDGKSLQTCRLFEQVERRLDFLGVRIQLFVRHHTCFAYLACDGTLVAHGLHDVSGSGFPLGTDEGRALRYTSQSFAEVAGTTDEWHLERVLVDVVLLVRGS